MRLTLLAVPFLALLVACSGVAPAVHPALDPVTAEATIRSLEEQERVAVLNNDTGALERLWAERFMVNAPINQVAPNRGVVMQSVKQGMIRYASFERRIEQVRFDGDIAIVMGGETVQPIGNTPLAGRTLQRRFTHLWKHEQGAWRLIARHANNVMPPQ